MGEGAAEDPDVDRRDPAERAEFRRVEWDVLAVVAIGGVFGAEARYGLGLAVPHASSAWPWSTLIINALGSALLGALTAAIGRQRHAPRLLRPFVGTGILGGFTTFSTYEVDAFHLMQAGRAGLAIAYLAVTVVICAVAVLAGMWAVER